MLKEILIAFLACLVLGAIINGLPQQPATAPQSSSPAVETTPQTAPQTTMPQDPSPGPAVKPLESSDANFEKDVLHAQVPVLVDFGASSCEPCKAMAPVMSKLAQEYQGRLKIVTIDTDANPELTQKYKIQFLPTFVMFNSGQKVNAYSGQLPQEMLANVIDKQLGIQ